MQFIGIWFTLWDRIFGLEREKICNSRVDNSRILNEINAGACYRDCLVNISDRLTTQTQKPACDAFRARYDLLWRERKNQRHVVPAFSMISPSCCGFNHFYLASPFRFSSTSHSSRVYSNVRKRKPENSSNFPFFFFLTKRRQKTRRVMSSKQFGEFMALLSSKKRSQTMAASRKGLNVCANNYSPPRSLLYFPSKSNPSSNVKASPSRNPIQQAQSLH